MHPCGTPEETSLQPLYAAVGRLAVMTQHEIITATQTCNTHTPLQQSSGVQLLP